MAYIYQADLFCDACGAYLCKHLTIAGVVDNEDSDTYPQGPYPNGGGEADSPEHCGSGPECLHAEVCDDRKIGAFLRNPLTADGVGYVAQAMKDNPSSEVVQLWVWYYGLAPTDDE